MMDTRSDFIAPCVVYISHKKPLKFEWFDVNTYIVPMFNYS